MRHLLAASLLLSFITTAWATPVGPMNFQGRLVDNNGVPVTGTYDFRVQVYDASVSGNQEYYEEHLSVFVDDGVYDLQIGTGTSVVGEWTVEMWQADFTDNSLNRYLQIQVDDGGGFETLTPRHELTSAPHAFSATLALSANSLGARTAADYDNILEGVCVGSNGKWLDIAGLCLGAGFSYPDPVHWSALITGSVAGPDLVVDLSNLDLTEADISNVDFGPTTGYEGADLSGSIFNKTTYKVENLDGANLTDTQWEQSVSTDVGPYALSSGTDVTGMTVKNMDMSKWGMSALNSGTASMFSAGYLPGLSACPASTPATLYWECREMRSGSGEYFTLGNNHNFSPSSAIAVTLDTGDSVLDIDPGSLDNKDVRYSSFSGITLSSQTFIDTDLFWVDFTNSQLKNINFTDTVLTSADFSGALLENVTIDVVIAQTPKFIGTKLSHVQFLNAELRNADFSYASLEEVDFYKLTYKTDFNNATLDGVRVHTSWGGAGNPSYDIFIDDSRIYGDFYVDTSLPKANRTFTNVSFLGGTWSGNFSSGAYTITFAGTLVFENVRFENLNLTSVVFPAISGSAITYGSNVTCPNGIVYPNGGHNCP